MKFRYTDSFFRKWSFYKLSEATENYSKYIIIQVCIQDA